MTAGAPPAAGNRRGLATRRRILAAAEERFRDRGMELSIDEVARAAGTTRMTVHRHTGGREALITQLVLRESADLAARLEAVLDGPGPFAGRLEDALVETVAAIRGAPHLVSLFTAGNVAGTWPSVDPDDRVMAAVHAFFGRYLRAAAAEGLLRSEPGPTTDWLLRQVLVFLAVPASAPDLAAVAHQVRTFVLPAVLVDPPAAVEVRAQRSDAATR